MSDSASVHPRFRSPILEYRAFGNQRPGYDQLQSFHNQILQQPEPTTTARLVLADICIDLAMSEYREEYFTCAHAQLSTAIDKIEAIEDPKKFEIESHALAVAYLRRAELPAWESAAQGKPPTPNYDELLIATKETI